MTKKDLIKKMEELQTTYNDLRQGWIESEKYCDNIIDKLSQRVDTLEETLNFVILHGKDKVVVKDMIDWWTYKLYTFKYMHNTKLRTLETTIRVNDFNIEIIQNEENEIIFKAISTTDKKIERYAKIDKASNTYMEIPKPAFVDKGVKNGNKET